MIQLCKRCGQLGSICCREAPVFVFERWLNARNLASLAAVERPGLAQVSDKLILASDLELLVVHVVVVLFGDSQSCSLLSSLAQHSAGAEVPWLALNGRVELVELRQCSSEASLRSLLGFRLAFAFFFVGGKSVLLNVEYLLHDLALQAETSSL